MGTRAQRYAPVLAEQQTLRCPGSHTFTYEQTKMLTMRYLVRQER